MGKRDHAAHLNEPFDEELHHGAVEAGAENGDPEALLMRSAGGQIIREAMDALPVEFREVLVLREIEGLSYKDIALVAEVPGGTGVSKPAPAGEVLRRPT